MASTSGRDRRPDGLSRLHSSAPPWIPAGVPTPMDTGLVDIAADVTPPEVDRPLDRFAVADDDESSTARTGSLWDSPSAPGWLDPPLADTGRDDEDRDDPIRRSVGRRRGPALAPPAAIALIAVGALACIVTVYTVFRGPSGDSPSAARVAFPATAGAAAPSGSAPSGSAHATAPASATGASSEQPTAPASTARSDEMVVSVVGLVRSPGLVRLSGAARVADAIDRAGGGRPGADLLSLNMAQLVRDGDQILVGFADPASGARMRSSVVSAGSGTASAPPSGGAPASGGSAASGTPGVQVNLNTADEAALDALPGVGPVTAQSIIDWRTRNGRFTSVDQLAEVDGIGPSRLAKLRDLVTV